MAAVKAYGPSRSDLMMVDSVPGHEEQQEGRPFAGKSGRELWAGLDRFCGVGRSGFYVTSLIKCNLGKGKEPKPAEIAAALPEFLDELESVRPRIVVTAGGLATRAMLGNVKMSDVHGIPHTTDIAGFEYICFPIYHPKAGLGNKGFLSAFAWDLQQLGLLLAPNGSLRVWEPASPPSVFYTVVGKPRKDFSQSGAVVSLDTEGWADKPWGLSFCFNGTGYIIPAASAVLEWFAGWIQGKTVVMHNGLHDIPVLRAMGVELTGCTIHDTQVLAYHEMIRTGCGVLEAESQNLGTLAYRELGMRLGELKDCKGVDFATQTIPYSDEVMQYAGEDAVATWRLFNIYQQRGLTDTQAYQIDMGQVPLIEQMIRTGLPFDADATLDYYMNVLDKLDTVTADLRASAARLGNRDFNPGSHPQVRDLVTRRIGLKIRKRTRGGKASTNEKALADHREHPFVNGLQTYRELTKLRGTYLAPLMEEIGQ